MFYPQSFLAKFVAKIVQKLIQKFTKSRGETAPGLLALKIDKNFLAHQHHKIKTKIVITGTNGKTTTTNLTSRILKNSKINFITNLSGSNLERGLATAILKKTKKTNTVLWEADEAAFIPIVNQIKPTHIVITNLFRDQLDRYGEIDTTFQKWFNCLKNLPKTTIILNSDDPNLAYLGYKLNHHKIIYFSVKQSSKLQSLKHSADSIYCPVCQKKLVYDNIVYSHLGDYSCSCHFKKPQAQYTASKIETKPDGSYFSIGKSNLYLPLLGTYNIYNALASYSLSKTLKIKQVNIKKVFSQFIPVAGRQEILTINNKQIQFWLVKNPTGYDQVLETLTLLNKKLVLCLALNDKIADGKDISWIWDVDFESFKPFAKKIVITGNRTFDLALRLKYANFPEKNFIIEPNKKLALLTLLDEKDDYLFILPTYTALWELRDILKDIKYDEI
jgi:lipid II isoglutaminyl synthase (glutamine-hydrolysing)